MNNDFLSDDRTDNTLLLPYSYDAEQTVIGAALIEPASLSLILEHINAEYFYDKKFGDVFLVILSLYASGTPADAVTVLAGCLKANIFPNETAGREFIASLMRSVPSAKNVESYCKIVAEKYYLRSLLYVCRDIQAEIADGSGVDAEKILDFAEQKIFDIRQGRSAGGLVHLREAVFEAYDRLVKITGPNKDDYLGAKTGYANLDIMTSGLNKSDLILLAARPGMGKTSFAINIATYVAKQAKRDVAIFSLEMSKEQLAARMLSAEAMIDSNSLRSGRIPRERAVWAKLADSANNLCDISMYIDDTAAVTAQQIKSKVRRMHNIGLVVIDYLQLMSSPLKTDNRVVIISEITRQLKIMAKEINIPIILLSQLARGPETRADKRPMLSDLRESGSIEQDADIVLFLYRDSYYNKDSATPNLTECIIGKNRHGETGMIELEWDGRFTRFVSSGG